MKNFFIPLGNFSAEEWILRYKVMSLLIITFIIGTYIFIFGIYRISTGYIFLGTIEVIFGLFSLSAFIYLRANKNYYFLFARIFFVLVYILLILIFLFIPEQATRIHWVPAALVFIFFLLDYKGGILFLGLYILFIVYLIFTGHPYSAIEYTTWISSLSAIAIVMYYYEKVKEREKVSLLTYASELKAEVDKQTKILALQNIELKNTQIELQARVEEELNQRKAQELLLHEVHHRVKNNLQIILSMIQLQNSDVENSAQSRMLIDLENRINTIATTYEMLIVSDNLQQVDMRVYIDSLLIDIQESFSHMDNDVTIETTIEANLPLREAVYVGLIVNELITNSYKYAFDTKRGAIKVSLVEKEKQYVLRVVDNGKGFIPEDNPTSLGLQLIQTLVFDQLMGTLTMKIDKGTQCEVVFTL